MLLVLAREGNLYYPDYTAESASHYVGYFEEGTAEKITS